MSSLTTEEQTILSSVERGEWHSVADVSKVIEQYQQYAQHQATGSDSIRIELSAEDLQALRTMAKQTNESVSLLVASVIHQYVVS